MKTTTHVVAMEFRRIADSLLGAEDAEIDAPLVRFFCYGNKNPFLALSNVLPRPLFKKFTDHDVIIGYGSTLLGKHVKDGPVWLEASVSRNALCRLILPAQEAVYECDPLLSEDELASLAPSEAQHG